MAVRGDKDAGFALAFSPSHLLHRAQQVAADHFVSRLSGGGVSGGCLTVRQFAVLCTIEAKPGSTQTELVNATGIDRSTLADLILRMQDRGLVSRNRATGDARANSVTLTPDGMKALHDALPHARAADEAILALLPKGKRQALITALRNIGQIEAEKAPAKGKVTKKAKSKAKASHSAKKASKPKKKLKKNKNKKQKDALPSSKAAPSTARKTKTPVNQAG